MATIPDLILHNGRFTTLDRTNPTASAVAIEDGRFVAVGREQDVMPLAGPATEVIDLGEAAAGTSLQPRDQDVSLRERAEDFRDEEFDSTFPFPCGRPAKPSCVCFAAACAVRMRRNGRPDRSPFQLRTGMESPAIPVP